MSVEATIKVVTAETAIERPMRLVVFFGCAATLALGPLGGVAFARTSSDRARAHHGHVHHAHRRHLHRPGNAPSAYGRMIEPSTSPDCRDLAGRPIDPDIIGGANHVGDGGPAVNQLGFDPCAY